MFFYHPPSSDSKLVYQFIDWVMKRRLSKEGEFYRVHFKTKAVVDLVPPGSLASGAKLIESKDGKTKWTKEDPPIRLLWDDFIDGRSKGKRIKPSIHKGLNRS